jgi:predicted lipoprotein with Yx(FWY)xxD motif
MPRVVPSPEKRSLDGKERSMRRARGARAAGLILPGALALLLASCGGLGQDNSPEQQAPQQPVYTTQPLAQQPAQPQQPAAAAFKVAQSQFGPILTDAQGRTLYGFTKDTQSKSTCYQACAKAWPPVVAQVQPQPGQGLNPALLTAIPRQDGTMQVIYGKWPLYYFTGDQQAGQTNGQGSKGVWFLVGANGKLVKTAAGGANNGGAATQTTAGGYGYGG